MSPNRISQRSVTPPPIKISRSLSHPATSTRDPNPLKLTQRHSRDETLRNSFMSPKSDRFHSEGNSEAESLRSRSPSERYMEELEDNRSDTLHFEIEDGDCNNNAPPAEYWQRKQPLADQIVITEVTVDLMTVTIRECTRQEGFFHDGRGPGRSQIGNLNGENMDSSVAQEQDAATSQAAAALMEMSSSLGHNSHAPVVQY